MVSLGDAGIMLNMHGQKGAQPVSLWIYTEQVDLLRCSRRDSSRPLERPWPAWPAIPPGSSASRSSTPRPTEDGNPVSAT